MVVTIFDGSKQITDRLVDLISETGKDIQIHNASSYNEAINLLKEYKPDAVILDWRFSGNMAADILKKAKQLNGNTVVIVLSGYIDPYVQEECKKLRADFLLNKYKDFEKIPAIINSTDTADTIASF